jgi:SAM-dependent methyltransferase
VNERGREGRVVRGGARQAVLGRSLFVTAIGLSAFLLFTLELLAGRLVLPVFGGAPSVWTTSLCFFTTVVFLGYLYAHLVAVRLDARRGGVLHVAVAALVVAATLLAPADISALRFPQLPPVLNVLAVLAVVAGAPALLLATTTPLLSAWFSQRGEDPWWLYAVSNGASLAGLLAYPLLIERFVPLSTQRMRLGFLLVLLVLLLAAVAVGNRRPASASTVTAETRVDAPAPSHRRQVLWLFAACIPAGLLSATTTLLTTDQVSAPLLWVGPLAVYLGSFVVAFSERGRRVLPLAEKLVPAAATLMWVPFLVRVSWPVTVLVPLLLVAFAAIAVAVHGRLALDRPAEAHLTRFYLVVSAGGMVATAFVALLAPLVFSDVYEYPVLLVGGLAALALLPGPGQTPAARGPWANLRAAGIRLAPYVIAAVVLVVLVSAESQASALFLAVVLAVGALVVFAGRTPVALAIGSTVAIVALTFAFAPPHLERVRTFFGITEVREAENGAARSEIHGTTLHGLQYLDARQAEPTAYFVRSGPLGDVFADLKAQRPSGADIGVVGLGIGTMAAYQRPADTLTFFEIDQSVIDLARDTRYFRYLADAPSEPRIVLGDGRLSLAEEPAGSFDLLLLDAFSSDAVPVHLLTREAMRGYERVLKPGGVLVFQLTNRHFNLAPAVASTARSLGLAARTRAYEPDASQRDRLAAQPSRWLVVGRPADIAAFDARGWTEPAAGPVLTDDYADILRLLRRQP